eukprot:GILI01001682.1.p1 GENE.GILI01001682.1~~GILI01001682.1.p1  ORF type:complete len:538 (+),score=206.95 GILI01001682.1:78-1691(+)
MAHLDAVGNALPQIFKDEAQEEKGENARLNAFVGAIAVGELVKSTLGPKGMDKILQPLAGPARGQNLTITNDGATILKSVHVDNAAAKILIDISKTQDAEVGDGTTTVVVLAAELLREAEKLVDAKIHPQIIIQGYRAAVARAREALDAAAQNHGTDLERFRKDLFNIASTTLSSKLLTYEKDLFANLAVDAVLRLKNTHDLDYIQIIKKPGGQLKDSYLEPGFILEKRMAVGAPKRIENCNIMIANTPMDTDKIKIYGAKVAVDSLEKIEDISEAEREKMRNKVEKICNHGINVFINRQLIYNYPEQIFAQKGVTSIEHADFEGIERLAAVLGGDIVSTFDTPDRVKLGHCDVIEEMMIGEDKVLRFSGCAVNEACTIVLRGASAHLLDEAERSLHDALCVLQQTVRENRVVYGGGNCETLMAKAVDELAQSVSGKQALAIEGFARALRALPTTVATNAGFDAAQLVSELRAAHYAGQTRAGLDMERGVVGDMEELGIMESWKVKRAALLSAAEAAEMILRVDQIVKCAPRKREGQ